MDAHDLHKALRQSWWLILLVVAVCAGAAVLQTLRTESRYESGTQLFVAAPERELSVRRAPSYAGLVTSPNVTTPVVRALRLPDTPVELGKRLTASTPPDTVLVNITVEDSDPARAQRTGRAVADRLIKLVEQLERPNSRQAPRVRMFVSSPASLPSDRVSPNARLNLLAGLVLGLIFGVLAAVARQRLDRRISTPADLPDGPGHGVLAAVPIDESAGTAPATVGLRGAGPERAEALRQLRTNLRFLAPDQPPRTIVVTSSLPGEGASTTAVGLAMAMAEGGADVVLVEADLRRPWLTDHLGLRRNQGLAGHLANGTAVEPLLQRWSGSRDEGALRVLIAGAVPPNPSELLSSRRMWELLEDLRARCDVVLIDAPPVLSVTDAAVLAGEADGVLLVVRMRRVTRPELERALGTLARARARVLGFVANGVAISARDKRRAYPPIPDAAATPRSPTPEPATARPRSPTPAPPAEPAAPVDPTAPAPRATKPPAAREPTTRTPPPLSPPRTATPTTAPAGITPRKPARAPEPATATPRPPRRTTTPEPATGRRGARPTAPPEPTTPAEPTDGAASHSPSTISDS